MSWPPDGCTYQVTYLVPGAEKRAWTRVFADEYLLGDWFKSAETRGDIDRLNPNFTIYAVVGGSHLEPINYDSPRLIQGRLGLGR